MVFGKVCSRVHSRKHHEEEKMRAHSFRRVTAVNLSAGVEYYRRLQDIFGVERDCMRVYNAGFREFALMPVSETGDETCQPST